jgi:hypothetical protein
MIFITQKLTSTHTDICIYIGQNTAYTQTLFSDNYAHLKYLVNLIDFSFPREQGFASEHLSEYAPYCPQVKGGGVLTLS